MPEIELGDLTLGSGTLRLVAGAIEDSFPSAEQAVATAVADSLPSVLIGQRFDGVAGLARRILSNAPTDGPPVLAFRALDGVAVVALVLQAQNGVRLYICSDLDDSPRWVDISQMRQFHALPATARAAQRQAWISKLSSIKAADRPAGVDLSSASLAKVASAFLRHLFAVLGNVTVPVSGVNQPADGFRGAQCHGSSLPLFTYPLVEPDCYLRVIAGREGVMESINAYDKGAGLSLRPIQFNAQRAAILKFLRAMDQADPTLFAQCLTAEGWTTSDANVGGRRVPVLTATLQSGQAVTLQGDETTASVGKVIAFLQSRRLDKPDFADINATWRKTLAVHFRDAVVWPHVQAIIQDVAANWLQPGLTAINAAGLQPIDTRRPERDSFVLRALLLSAYVRFWASLQPFLHALAPFATPAKKLAMIQTVLLDSGAAWSGLSFARRKALAKRLSDQEPEAEAVWQTIIRLADATTVAPHPAMANTLAAKPIVIVDEEVDLQYSDHPEAFAVPNAAPADAGHLAGDTALDPSVAVPPFAASKRAQMMSPMLTATASATAVQWNSLRHPSVSGISVRAISAALDAYVDLDALAATMGEDRSDQIDAVFVEAVHQFQSKVFADPSDLDGRAGEASLDALGFYFGRRGMNGVDIANPTAQAFLLSAPIKPRLAHAADNPKGAFAITAENWFSHMMQTSFLGQKFTNGIHAALVRRLRKAEAHLLTLPAYQGMTPVELGRALGIREPHKGSRPNATTGSMHTLGLATDINYVGNPWVSGTGFPSVLRHAILLMLGRRLADGSAAALFFSLTGLPTGEIYDSLARWNGAFKAYLALAKTPQVVTQLVQDHHDYGTNGVLQPGENVAQATARWRGRITADLASLGSNDGFSSGRDPRAGFLDQNRDLVVALRDHGCLSWGATDFGPGSDGSGDVMHSDCRNTGIGRIVNRGFAPAERPC